MKLSSNELEWFNTKEYRSLFTMGLADLRQIEPLYESALLRLARERKIPVKGVVTGEPSTFYKMGLLSCDEILHGSRPRFHPFRLHTLDKLLQFGNQPIDWLAEQSVIWNHVVDLAILLEPIYWPLVTGLTCYSHINEHTRIDLVTEYKEAVLNFVRKLHAVEWQAVHQSIKFDASKKDDNSDLYLLLRSSSWKQRSKLTGSISAAVWFRHIAEVLRLGFEEAHEVEWFEEDYCYGYWREGDRTIAYGTERPIENRYLAQRYLLQSFGLLSGSVVRWYVEGPTEYHALLTLIPEPSRLNIEVVDLMGNIKTEKQNIALKLKNCLETDIEQRRFSFISFDSDVRQNVKTIKQQVIDERVCGYIAAHNPDFEFANFSIEELVRVAAEFDKNMGFDPTGLLATDWSNIKNGKQFESKYIACSERGLSLKGEFWGQALARFMEENPKRDGQIRPFLKQLDAAFRAIKVKYEYQKERFRINPDTFENDAIEK